jgi:citronellol/citronellal dehydrogenase
VAQPKARSLTDRVLLITGTSRGIGREMAARAAAGRARVGLLAKTGTPNPKNFYLPSTPLPSVLT